MQGAALAELVTIRAGKLTCQIAPLGAELRSLRDAVTGDEFIWQRDPLYWAGSAPILFPVIGRLNAGGYLLDGHFYEIAKHGFARYLNFAVVACSDESATFQLTDNEVTKAAYPYAFLLETIFSLQGRTLAVDYRVVNRNDREMYFALGSHPAFNLPLNLGALENWSIRFDKVEAPVCHRVTENLLSSVPEPFEFAAGNCIVLSEGIFDRDALIFKGIQSRRLEIVHDLHGVRVQFDTGGSPTLGIWAKPGAPFVCLEPWCGFDDSSEIHAELPLKPGMLRLSAGETFVTGYRITV